MPLTFAFLVSFASAAPLVPEGGIVSLGGPITETVCALGACERLVGADSGSQWPASVLALPQVGFHRRVSAEGVLSLRPAVVLAGPDAGPPAALAQLQAAGVVVVQVPGDATEEGAKQRIRFLAEALGRPAEGAALLADLDRRLAEVQSSLAGKPAPRVVFLYARGGGAPQVAGRGTAAAEMIGLAGGRLATDHAEYRAVSPEVLLAARPDVVLVTRGGLEAMGGEGGIWAVPGLASTPAGTARRLVVVDDLLLLGFGPRLPEAVAELARGLHGERR
jgi:iron complex transport system substrate-binding protein